MNRTYSIVWSAVRNMYVVASELARGHSKVKAQVCASETHSPNKKSEYGQIIKATRAALACAVAAALGFFSPLAMADNQVSYIDGKSHDLSTETSQSLIQVPARVQHCLWKVCQRIRGLAGNVGYRHGCCD